MAGRPGRATANVIRGRNRKGIVSIRVEGKERIIKNLRKYHSRAGGAYSQGLEKALKFLKRKSNAVAPEESGTLIKQSAVVLVGKGFEREGAVIYGPAGTKSAAYALVQHEKYEIKRKPGRQWKYLEQPFRENRMEMLRIIADEIRKLK